MFKKGDYNLRSDFRKLLQVTNEQFKSGITSLDQRTILVMWNKIVGESECITVTRFQKYGSRLGIKIVTTKSKLGYMHEIVNIADKSIVSNVSSIQCGDTILEVNGVNLLLLNYNQLALTLGALPNNIQFVLLKKDGEGVYERTDISTPDDHYHLVKDNGETWWPPINIIIQSSPTKSHGLEFINSTQKSRNLSLSVIQKINKDGYFYDDRRVCINDSIFQLNGKDLRDYSFRDMYKTFNNNRRCAFIISICKYHSNGSSSDIMNMFGSRISLPNSSIGSIKRNQSTYSAPNSFTKSMRKPRQNSNKESSMSIKNEYETLNITLDPTDDLKIYLVDVKESEERKCIICGFHNSSTLRRKFQFKDQIIMVNDEDTLTMTNIEVGLALKKYRQKKIPITITVLRKSRDVVTSNDNLIISPNVMTVESESPSSAYVKSCPNGFVDNQDGDFFYVSLCKKNESFGLEISNQDGPTIVGITTGSVADKSGLVKVGDKIIRINDIYVVDKEESFVLTILGSCGSRMNIELLRRSSHDPDIQFMENQTYFCSQNLNSSGFDSCYDSKHSIFSPLPPVPENEINKESNTKKK